MPLIGLLTWWLIGLLTRSPEKLNYINVTEKNQEKQYNMLKKIMILIQNLAFIIFILTNEAFIRYAVGIENSVFIFLTMLLLAVILLALFYNLIWTARLNK